MLTGLLWAISDEFPPEADTSSPVLLLLFGLTTRARRNRTISGPDRNRFREVERVENCTRRSPEQ